MEQKTQFNRGPIAADPSPYLTKTATTDGLTTGKISADELVNGYAFVTVTAGGDANSIITLPDAPISSRVDLYVGATGYELRTHAPASVAINGGTGSAGESAIGTTVHTRCERTTATNWVCTDYAAAGTVSATQVAAN